MGRGEGNQDQELLPPRESISLAFDGFGPIEERAFRRAAEIFSAEVPLFGVFPTIKCNYSRETYTHFDVAVAHYKKNRISLLAETPRDYDTLLRIGVQGISHCIQDVAIPLRKELPSDEDMKPGVGRVLTFEDTEALKLPHEIVEDWWKAVTESEYYRTWMARLDTFNENIASTHPGAHSDDGFSRTEKELRAIEGYDAEALYFTNREMLFMHSTSQWIAQRTSDHAFKKVIEEWRVSPSGRQNLWNDEDFSAIAIALDKVLL
jgi:hypothetical protein